MIFRTSGPRGRKAAPKPKERLLPFGLRGPYRRLQQVNEALLINHYHEQRSYIAAVNMQYAIHAVPLLPDEKIRIHFLYAAAKLWPLWDALYRVCAADARLETTVVFLDSGNGPDAAFLRERGIAHIPYADYDPYALRPHMMVCQSPLDGLYLRFAKCKANFVKKHGIRPVCLCGPEYDAPKKEAHNTLYQQYAQMFAWRVLAPRREIKEDFYRHCLAGGDAVLVTGAMDGKGIVETLLEDLREEDERLRAGSGAALRAALECLPQGMGEER